jgi:hypothetical protein
MKAQTTQDAANQPAPITTQVIEFYLMALAAARTPEEAKQKTADTFRAVNSHAANEAKIEVLVAAHEKSLLMLEHALAQIQPIAGSRAAERVQVLIEQAQFQSRDALALARGNQ